jgi:hypothetical protein
MPDGHRRRPPRMKRRGGRGGGSHGWQGRNPYIGAVQLPFHVAVGPTAVLFDGRSPLVSQPPFQAVVGRLPPLALAVGAY